MPFYPVAKPEDYPELDQPRKPWDEWGPQEQERILREALGEELWIALEREAKHNLINSVQS